MAGLPCPKPLRHKATGRRVATPAESAHMVRVKAMPCIACLNKGLAQTSPTEVHHIKRDPTTGGSFGMGHERASNWWVLPLCRDTHHWNSTTVHMSQAQFEAENGNELDLLEQTYQMLGYERPQLEAA